MFVAAAVTAVSALAIFASRTSLFDARRIEVTGANHLDRADLVRIAGVSPEQLRQPERPGKWSIAQVLQHLSDTEIVGAWRFRLILAQDRPQITGYDQDIWADRLHYADADPAAALELFTVVRRANLRLLELATAADLARVGLHAERGEESVGHLRNLYAGHDLLQDGPAAGAL